MHSRLLPSLLPVVFLTAAAASLTAPAAQAQTPPTITATLTGSGTTNFKTGALDYRNYTFNITGFSNVGPDPTGAYTIYSFSNSSIENNPLVAGIAAFDLPSGWSFDDSNDFVISTSPNLGIHALDPTFGLTIFQIAGTPTVSPTGAPFELYHQINGVDPFLNPNGTPLTVNVNAVPEASSMVSFSLLLLGGLAACAFRRRRVA